MCGVCGCGRPDDPAVEHDHVLTDGTKVRHAHGGGASDHHHEHHDEHAHEHEHVGADGKAFRHSHAHDHHDADHGAHHEHQHEHQHVMADGSIVRHAHGHEHTAAPGEHEHVLPDGRVVLHSHGGHAHEEHDLAEHTGDVRHPHGHQHHENEHEHGGVVRADRGPTGTDIAGVAPGRILQVQQDIMGKNDELARANRVRFAKAGSFVVNLMSSPGSGKTTLLTRTLKELSGKLGLAVIEGDQQTSLDADRIRATGVPAVQVNTGKGCHLDASMVGRALEQVKPPKGVLFIENVGNLVCPAGFDLGESKRVVVVSVTEGEDKPLKYPDMFSIADVVVVNKADLLPHLAFDVALLEANIRKLKPGVPIFRVSAATGAGFDAWLAWLVDGAAQATRGESRP